jgi:superfamily II DNA or RNA helicase
VASWERRWSEAEPGDLLAKVTEIATELEGETPALVKLVEEGQREAERQRKEREEQYQKYLREEREKRRQENIKAARDDLVAAIQSWGALRNIEAFFASVEAQTASLPDDERAAILDRLARGRALIGPIDALGRLREWVAPEERSLERRWY